MMEFQYETLRCLNSIGSFVAPITMALACICDDLEALEKQQLALVPAGTPRPLSIIVGGRGAPGGALSVYPTNPNAEPDDTNFDEDLEEIAERLAGVDAEGNVGMT
jgi:hypothetical protein